MVDGRGEYELRPALKAGVAVADVAQHRRSKVLPAVELIAPRPGPAPSMITGVSVNPTLALRNRNLEPSVFGRDSAASAVTGVSLTPPAIVILTKKDGIHPLDTSAEEAILVQFPQLAKSSLLVDAVAGRVRAAISAGRTTSSGG